MAAPIFAAAAKWAAKNAGRKAVVTAAQTAKKDGNKGPLLAFGGVGVAFIGLIVLSMILSIVGAIGGLLGALGGLTAGGAGVSAANECLTTSAPVSATAVADIPPLALEAYQQASEASGVDWVFIAAIGKVETDHARFGGRTLDANGDVQPTPIEGPMTDYGRAVGPMQFLTSTWESIGKDGNFDGKKDPQNIFDAAYGTGFYLKVNGAPGNMRKAIFAYNHATWYVDKVMAQAKEYRAASVEVDPDGNVTEPIKGQVAIAHANIPGRTPAGEHQATLRTLAGKNPDFIGLNEQSARSLGFLEATIPAYDAWRDPKSAGDANSMGNVIMWKTSEYRLVDKGRVQLVEDDHTVYNGNPVTSGRYATWGLFERKSDGAIMSFVSTHMMTNPAKFGPDMPKRQKKYGQGMDLLVSLVNQLNVKGPVFVAGDMNNHDYQREDWNAVPNMQDAGFAWYHNAVDYIFFQKSLGITLADSTKGPTPEPDHMWLFSRFDMNGAGAVPVGPVAPASRTSASSATIDGESVDITTVAYKTNAKGSADEDGEDVPADDGNDGAAWTTPLAPGTYTLTARWGESGSNWSSYHTGLDFAAPLGTPVYAAADGVIKNDKTQSWAGPNLLTIDHGTVDGQQVVTWYAHLSSAAVTSGPVEAGQLIGYVGALGNVSSPTAYHLHFEVHVGSGGYYDTDVDPFVWLAGAGAPDPTGIASDGCGPTGSSGIVNGNGAWGGYQNGQIPLSAMCKLSFYATYLECGAAKALEALNGDYQKKFGTNVGPVGGYRSYAAQVECQRLKGSLCATPGTSNHGWGLAADLAGGGINEFGTPQHLWMRKNASNYGWVLPSWAKETGSKPEPWHWEFVSSGNSAGIGGTPVSGPIGQPPTKTGVSATFRIGSWNVLGASHTEGPGCNKCPLPDSGPRMERAVQVIKRHNLDVLGMQEFQPTQHTKFKALMPGWNIWGDRDNQVAWDSSVFKFVTSSKITIPYFSGSNRQMPVVRLRHLGSGAEIVVLSVHNPADARGPAQQWRDESVKIEADITRNLASAGLPVYLTGDMNDRERFFCPIMEYGHLAASAGGSYSGSCNPPANMNIDWVMGTTNLTTFHSHSVDDGADVDFASDHPIIVTQSTARN
jgi:murein DD-endopeptidase MepM/ murein hydrolase activator NlpD/endonuclease/exonuclease/phosphatase family metal-dependent hydrolase